MILLVSSVVDRQALNARVVEWVLIYDLLIIHARVVMLLADFAPSTESPAMCTSRQLEAT